MRAGRFITIEGGEGVGKSTQIAAARAEIKKHGFKVVVTREPGGTERAERIREILLQPTAEPMPDSCELLLVFAARAAHLHNLIVPELNRGAWVVCDRFTDATYAYQGAGRGIPTEHIALLENLVQGDLRPDLTLLLDAPVAIAMARARARNLKAGASEDRFEQERSQFFERMRAGYLNIAHANPDRIRIVDAGAELEQVEQAVRREIREFVEHQSQH